MKKCLDFAQKIWMKFFLAIILCFSLPLTVNAQLSVHEKINDRSFPSICSMVEINYNLPGHVSANENTAYHDIMWAYPYSLKFSRVDGGIQLVGSPENVAIHDPGGDPIKNSIRSHEEIRSYNSNLVFMFPLPTRAVGARSVVYGDLFNEIPWLRDTAGNFISGNDPGPSHRIDFSHPHYINMLVEMAVAVDNHEFYNGIIFDSFGLGANILPHLTHAEEEGARIEILRRIREAVSDNFLILASGYNSNAKILAPYINGIYMESYRAKDHDYKLQGLKKIEQSLFWAENNLQKPLINCLEAEGLAQESPKSPRNQQWMRLFTTLSLTHSDGYVVYTMGIQRGEPHQHDAEFRMPHPWTPNHLTNDIRGHGQDPLGVNHGHSHHHYWYDFYDAELGRPVGKKAQLYEGIEGLFIREFTNGWAVYNRSGKAQQVEFSEAVSGVASGVKNKRSHALPDLDGEIYLKTVVQVAPGKYPPLYWINAKTDTLQRLVDSEIKNLISGTQNATSLTVDAVDGKLYWTTKTNERWGEIHRVNLKGTPRSEELRDLYGIPLDITVDPQGKKLYWIDALNRIQRSDLNAQNIQNIFRDLKAPKHITLDVGRGKLYWTEQTSDQTSEIRSANLDGSNVQRVTELTSAPRGLTIDAVNGKLYLTNADGKIQRLNVDGSNFQSDLITDLDAPKEVSVDVVGRKIYWTEQGSIRRADFNGENIEDVVTGLGAPTGIVIGNVPPAAPAAPATAGTPPDATVLLANYPNPFNPETWIPYQLAKASDVKIVIYDTRGVVVRQLNLGHQPIGFYTNRSRAAYWDGRNALGERVASGVYFYQLQADNVSALRKMLILK